MRSIQQRRRAGRTDNIVVHIVAAVLFVFVVIMSGCSSSAPVKPAPILLFVGAGTSKNDVTAVETILRNKHFDYVTTNTQQLNALTEAQLSLHKLLIVPGGNFMNMSDSLTHATTANIHNAVQNGLNYLGICAGAFLAGQGAYNSMNLTSGVKFGFYEAENRGIRKAIVRISTVNAQTIEQYWEDGPSLAGWGAVVAKYPDGTPAVVQGQLGKGSVILAGTHPEAPQNWWRGMTSTMPASVANVYAGELVEAALNGVLLPHY